MMSGKIKGAFNDEQFEAFCEELRALPARERTLEGIARIFRDRTGIEASVMAAKSFKDGPFARYLEKLSAGRQTREALVAAAGAGAHPLDAIEEAAILELQDHLTEAEGGEVDVSWVASQLLKLRTALTMREDSRRKNEDLERKQRETAAKLELVEQIKLVAEERAKKLERERETWERKQREIAEQLDRARNATGKKADEVRAAAVDEIDRIMGITPAA